jgi:hypothetical protein
MESDMRFGHVLWLGLAYSFVAGSGVILIPSAVRAQPFEYVITFDNVVVRAVDTVDTPDLAHLELPRLDKAPPVESGSDRPKRTEGVSGQPPKAPEPGSDRRTPGPETPAGQLPRITMRLPGSLLPSEPGQGTENPSFVQEGFLVEAFWARRIGAREGFFKRAHFHPPDLSTGFEGQHLGNPDELHGIYVRSLDGKRFGIKSLRYRVTRNRQLPGKPLSIEGFSNYSVNVLVARSFDPRMSIRSQFTLFPVGLPVGSDMSLPWWTLRIFGFQLVDQLYIASSASVDFDDIVLTRIEPPSPPH